MSRLGVLAEYERRAEPYQQVGVSPWIEELVRRYRDPPPPRRTAWVLLAALLFIGGLLTHWLSRLDAMAYPAEPAKRQALELCSREDPTFIRFFASDRDSCYARLHPGRPRRD